MDLAIDRPWMTAFGTELYPTPFEKAAAISESIVRNHPFNDGNHRTALAALHLILGLHQLKLAAPKDAQKDMIIGVGAGTIEFRNFVQWIQQYSILRPDSGEIPHS